MICGRKKFFLGMQYLFGKKDSERRIQNPVGHLRWSFLQK